MMFSARDFLESCFKGPASVLDPCLCLILRGVVFSSFGGLGGALTDSFCGTMSSLLVEGTHSCIASDCDLPDCSEATSFEGEVLAPAEVANASSRSSETRLEVDPLRFSRLGALELRFRCRGVVGLVFAKLFRDRRRGVPLALRRFGASG